MHRGFVKIWRCIEDNGFCATALKLGFWSTLLLMANHREKKMMIGGKSITLAPGEFATSRKSLSARMGISENKTERFLSVLENEQQIRQQGFSKFRIISIVNWDKYQGVRLENKQQTDSKQTASRQQVDTNKNERMKECKNERKKPTPPSAAEIPGWLDATVWEEFKEHRHSLRSPLTHLAQTKIINQLFRLMQDGHNPTEVLDQSIANSWKGVFPVNERKTKRTIPGMEPGVLSEKGQRTALNAKAVLERMQNEQRKNH